MKRIVTQAQRNALSELGVEVDNFTARQLYKLAQEMLPKTKEPKAPKVQSYRQAKRLARQAAGRPTVLDRVIGIKDDIKERVAEIESQYELEASPVSDI